jgi:hypothetical protein
MSEDIKQQTIEDIRNADGFSKQILLERRKQWLKEQRKQDRKAKELLLQLHLSFSSRAYMLDRHRGC